jgi:hypothetical protein
MTAAAWRALGLPFNRRLLVFACALAVLSVGLPWQRVPEMPGLVFPGMIVVVDGPYVITYGVIPPYVLASVGGYTIPGAGHAMRLAAFAAALLLWLAIRRGSRRLGWLALAVAAVALPLGIGYGALMPGRLAYAGALVLTAVAIGLPHRRAAASPDRVAPPGG